MCGEASEESNHTVRRGNGDGMFAQGYCSNTGSPTGWSAGGSNQQLVRARLGQVGWRRGP